MSRLFDLSGKVALVTGSSRGIGRAIVEEYARAGAKVVISSRKLEACEKVRDLLLAEGHDAIAMAAHAGSKAELASLVEKTISHYGRLDICVANAAVNPFYGSLTDAPDEAFDKTMATNVKAVWWLAQLAKPHLVASREGNFIVISSIAAIRGLAGARRLRHLEGGRDRLGAQSCGGVGPLRRLRERHRARPREDRLCPLLVGKRDRPQETRSRDAAEAPRRADRHRRRRPFPGLARGALCHGASARRRWGRDDRWLSGMKEGEAVIDRMEAWVHIRPFARLPHREGADCPSDGASAPGAFVPGAFVP
jgi:hypothetical protein